MKCSCAVFLGVMLFSVTVSAQSWPSLATAPAVQRTGSNDVAVIVAIEDYAFLPDVPNAVRNAAEWETFFTNGLGIPTVLTLTNQQAVREDILDFANRASSVAAPDSTLWFVFIGHGAPAANGADGLLIGADGQQNVTSMTARGVLQNELLAALEKGSQSNTVVLLDACFSGRTSTGEALAVGMMPVVAVDAPPTTASTTVVMTAATADQFAGDLPEAQRPAFSYLMLGALRGWADDAGDGEVTAAEAITFARRELLRIPGRTQTPQIAGLASLVLTRGALEPRPATAAIVATPAADVSTVAPHVLPPPDGKADSMFFANAQIGTVLSGASNLAASYGLTAGAGVKVKEFRFGLLGVLGRAVDPGIPPAGTTLPSDRSTGFGTVESEHKNRTARLGGAIAASVGYGLRQERAGRADNVLWVDAVSGINFGSKCNGYRLSTADGRRGIQCDGSAQSTVGYLVGGRVGGNFGIFSAAVLAGARGVGSITDLIATIGIGVALDD